MIITQDEYNEIFKGFYINGVAVRDTGYIYITTREKRDDIAPVMEEHLARKILFPFFDEPLESNGDTAVMKEWTRYFRLQPVFHSVSTWALQWKMRFLL